MNIARKVQDEDMDQNVVMKSGSKSDGCYMFEDFDDDCFSKDPCLQGDDF
jgi:hypothetical protein